MKRYWLFGYDQYYPCGGMNDFRGDYDDLEGEDFKQKMLWVRESCDHFHVWDTVKGKEIYVTSA